MFFLNLKTVQTVLLQHLIDCVHPVYSYRQKVQKGMENKRICFEQHLYGCCVKDEAVSLYLSSPCYQTL